MVGGSLCSGAGGLDLGLERALGVEWAWHCEPDPACSRVLAARWPGVPNHGDIFAVDWETVAPVDLVCAGFPCPAFSLAGKRLGMADEVGRVWFGVAAALRVLRPRYCVFENVGGIVSAAGLCVESGERAVGVVLADLAALGYRWAYDRLRAADLGAPHGRDRWFCVARLADGDGRGPASPASVAVGVGVDADGRVRRGGAGEPRPGGPAPPAVAAGQEVDGAEDALADDPGAAADAVGVGLDGVGGRDEAAAPGDRTDRGGSLRDLPDLLASAADAERVAGPEAGELAAGPGAGGEQGARREAGEAERRAAGRARGRGDRLLPTPTAGDGKAAGSRNLEGSRAHPGVSLTDAIQTGDSSTPRRLLPTPSTGESKTGHGRRGGKPGNGAQSGAELDAIVEASGEIRLLPTPQAADGDGGRQEKGAMGAGGVRPSGQKATLPLPTAVSMRETISETPFAATDGGGGQGTLFDVDRPAGEQLLPTPLVTSERKSRGSMVENQQWSAPSLGQAVEIAAGVLPREFDSWDEVPGELGRQSRSRLLPTPVANPENPGAGGELRAAVVHGEGRRNETGVDTLGRPNRGRGPLLPTPTTQDAENTAGPSQRERNTDPLNVAAARLLPTPTAADGDRSSEQGPRHYPGGDDNPTLLGVARRSDVEWRVYDAAIRRWEAVLGRQAPRPTDEKGRLDPPFPAWMLGYPEGWFDVEGVSRTAALRAIGNSVQVQASEEVGHWLRFLVEAGVL